MINNLIDWSQIYNLSNMEGRLTRTRKQIVYDF